MQTNKQEYVENKNTGRNQMKINEKNIIKIIKEEYMKRLAEIEIAARIAEAQLVDKRGNLLLSPDLKVKHKKSGFEYTIDSIDGDGKDMMIYLRTPESTRVEPPSVMKRMNELDEDIIQDKEKSGDIKITQIIPPSGEPLADLPSQDLEDVFAVTAQEFKKEYIVD